MASDKKFYSIRPWNPIARKANDKTTPKRDVNKSFRRPIFSTR